MPIFVLIHCLFLVTPGLSPTLAVLFLAILFIKEDLPTLGIPTTIALVVIFTTPFALNLSCFSFKRSFIIGFMLFNPFPVTQFTLATLINSLDSFLIHSLVTLSSER